MLPVQFLYPFVFHKRFLGANRMTAKIDLAQQILLLVVRPYCLSFSKAAVYSYPKEVCHER